MATALRSSRTLPKEPDCPRRPEAAAGTRRRRIVVVSNRVPSSSQQGCAGGLVTALGSALAGMESLWFGWSGRIADKPDADPTLRCEGRLSIATADLSPADHAGYYSGFANRTLWPLFHDRQDLAAVDPGYYRAYRAVNEMFACQLAPMVRRDDLVWVHDYHFLLLGRELRNARVEAPLGFFLHTPFPSPDAFAALPFAWRLHMMRGLCAYDLVGFQTRRDLRNFVDFFTRALGGRAGPDDTIYAFGRRVRLGVFPIGIEVEKFVAAAASPDSLRQAARLRRRFEGHAVLGVDRLDYTKGLAERMSAFERLLESAVELRGRVSYVQIAAPSRVGIPEYAALGARLERMSGRINGRFGQLDWVPVRYLNRSLPRSALPSLYRAARVGLVTPLRDGMNLVAKEFVAAQDPDDPGVLVLSRFAGAAEGMDGALRVDPHDTEAVARALRIALGLPQQERCERWAQLMEGLRRDDIHAWSRGFLSALEETASRPFALASAAE